MDPFAAAERLMRMDDAAWTRHASPWSVGTRFTTLPLLALAIWSRVWIGWWALLPAALAIVWTWVNPRVFPPPADMDGWAQRGTLGERLWLRRREVPLPAGHLRAGRVLTAISAAGLLPLVWGLWALEPFAVLAGLAVTMLAKAWFFDRMVWLHHEMGGSRAGGGPE